MGVYTSGLERCIEELTEREAKLVMLLKEVTGSFHAAVAFDSLPRDGELIAKVEETLKELGE